VTSYQDALVFVCVVI